MQAEGFINLEAAESLLLGLFKRIKREALEEENEGAGVEIMRGKKRIKPGADKFRVEVKDVIRMSKKGQVNLVDEAGNKMALGAKTEIKIDGPTDFELLGGTITAFIRKLKPKSKFDLKIPFLGVNSIRGTIFSVWTDGETMTLTVVEGQVEFSDLKGNAVMVKENQSCICSKEQGLQLPVTLPVNLKEQYKEE
ncbi:MAG: FecR domain-containing protein [Actinomycetota bacterium]|nr:FecR domain-containing protein [Actinomycetota bacterium]